MTTKHEEWAARQAQYAIERAMRTRLPPVTEEHRAEARAWLKTLRPMTPEELKAMDDRHREP